MVFHKFGLATIHWPGRDIKFTKITDKATFDLNQLINEDTAIIGYDKIKQNLMDEHQT